MDKRNTRRTSIVADNYNFEALELCRDLLWHLRIHSTVHLSKWKDAEVVFGERGMDTTPSLYRIGILRKDGVAKFAETIGMTINRKQKKLETFLASYYNRTYSGGWI